MRAKVPEGPAVIEPTSGGAGRPFWSVMIPTYNASALLEEALRSVLDQDPGPDLMQIAVVDDCSPTDEARRIVDRLAPGRVEFHRARANVGLAGNWNACLDLSRGRWVHLLHQDDLIRPGFYERLAKADPDPSVGMAFSRHAFIDDRGEQTSVSPLEREEAGVLPDWLDRISRCQWIQCPSVAVRRSIYEELGGFRTDLRFILDWEMWVRIAARHATWYEPTVLASYRQHGESETSRLRKDAADLEDFRLGLEKVAAHLPIGLRRTAGLDMIRHMSGEGMNVVYRLMSAGDYRAGMAQLGAVCHFDPRLRFSRVSFTHLRWALKLWLVDLGSRWTAPRNPPSGDPSRVEPDAVGIAAGHDGRGGDGHG